MWWRQCQDVFPVYDHQLFLHTVSYFARLLPTPHDVGRGGVGYVPSDVQVGHSEATPLLDAVPEPVQR